MNPHADPRGSIFAYRIHLFVKRLRSRNLRKASDRKAVVSFPRVVHLYDEVFVISRRSEEFPITSRSRSL